LRDYDLPRTRHHRRANRVVHALPSVRVRFGEPPIRPITPPAPKDLPAPPEPQTKRPIRQVSPPQAGLRWSPLSDGTEIGRSGGITFAVIGSYATMGTADGGAFWRMVLDCRDLNNNPHGNSGETADVENGRKICDKLFRMWVQTAGLGVLT
jgi:hypothetical protein